jgi:hypothetical protein
MKVDVYAGAAVALVGRDGIPMSLTSPKVGRTPWSAFCTLHATDLAGRRAGPGGPARTGGTPYFGVTFGEVSDTVDAIRRMAPRAAKGDENVARVHFSR